MRILYVILTQDNFERYPIGGVENQIHRYKQYLQERGHQVAILRLSGREQSVNLLDPRSIDVVHVMSVWTDYVLPIVKHYKGKVPIVVSPVYNDRDTMIKKMTAFWKKYKLPEGEELPAMHGKLKESLKTLGIIADYIAILAKGEQDQLIKAGVPNTDQFYYLPNGVDVSLSKALDRAFSIGASPVILNVGRVEVNKNQLNLIQAFKRVIEKHPKAQLWIAGAETDQPYARECHDEAAGLPVHFLGSRTPLEIFSMMKLARVIALPSISECVPLTMLEGATMGKPLVCTDASYTFEYLQDWPWYCSDDPDSISTALLKAWETPESEAVKKKARQEFSYGVVGQVLLNFYAKVIQGYEYPSVQHEAVEWLKPEAFGLNSPLTKEHFYRYQVAQSYLRSSDIVVDAACGTGYGAALFLANKCAKVLAIDRSNEALEYGEAHYGGHLKNILWIKDDLEKTALTGDVLVSLETIEHLPDPAKFLNKAKQSINRLIILSTPIEPTKHLNKFHLQDFTRAQVEKMLAPWKPIHFEEQRGSSLYGIWVFQKPGVA